MYSISSTTTLASAPGGLERTTFQAGKHHPVNLNNSYTFLLYMLIMYIYIAQRYYVFTESESRRPTLTLIYSFSRSPVCLHSHRMASVLVDLNRNLSFLLLLVVGSACNLLSSLGHYHLHGSMSRKEPIMRPTTWSGLPLWLPLGPFDNLERNSSIVAWSFP